MSYVIQLERGLLLSFEPERIRSGTKQVQHLHVPSMHR